MIISRADHEAALAEVRRTVADPRVGLFGPGSVTWQIGHDIALFIGGPRAILLQLAHPFVAFAIDHHSQTRGDVAGRFRRTFEGVFAMVFGDWNEAARAARRVHAIHSRVRGAIGESAGAFVAGTPYHANDVAALIWVHTTLVDTTVAIRELFDGPLDESTKDRYIGEIARFGALFGIPRAMLPGSWRAHRGYFDATLPTLGVARCAREMAEFVVGRGHRGQTALGRIAEGAACALLPEHLVAEFGLRGSPPRWRRAITAFAAGYRRLPSRLVEIPAYTAACDRLAGRLPSRYSAWTQRVLDGLAKRTAG